MDEHTKHLQLGVELSDDGPDPVPEPLDDPDYLDALWATATTVEQFKIDIELLASNGT